MSVFPRKTSLNLRFLRGGILRNFFYKKQSSKIRKSVYLCGVEVGFWRWRKSGESSAKKGHFKAFWGVFDESQKDTKKPAIPLFMRVCGLLKVAPLQGFEPWSPQ